MVLGVGSYEPTPNTTLVPKEPLPPLTEIPGDPDIMTPRRF